MPALLRRKTPLTCPRRMLDWGPFERETCKDNWRPGHGLSGSTLSPSCSFCGSLHPDVFMDKVRAGWRVEGTDKSYKWYLGEPIAAEVMAERKAEFFTSTFADRVRQDGRGEAMLQKAWEEQAYYTSHNTVAKFYTPHLIKPLAEEFVSLWRDQQINHSMYVRPWLPALAEDAPDFLL